MIEFDKMTDMEFQEYLERLIIDYSKDLTKVKEITLGEAIKQAESEIKELLPEGYETTDNFIGFIKQTSSIQKEVII